MIEKYSSLEPAFKAYEDERTLKMLKTPVAPWTGKDATPEAREERKKMARASQRDFNRIYLPPEMFAGQYAEECDFHWLIQEAHQKRDRECTGFAGPHDHAKSAQGYMCLLRDGLFGLRKFVGICGWTLDTPRAIIPALASYYESNARILYDFPELSLPVNNTEELRVVTDENPGGTVFYAFAENRSPRGRTVDLVFRIDKLVVEDFENRSSSMTPEAVQKRREKLAEFQSALGEDGCLVFTANNFDHRCIVNQMLLDQEKGELDESWQMYKFQAWGQNPLIKTQRRKPGPLWKSRFPAKSEDELRKMLKPMDNATWQGSYQQNPKKPEGYYFDQKYHAVWNAIPEGSMGVIYIDPNLSKKGKGDRTAMLGLFWHPETMKVYVYVWAYRSFSDSNVLLENLRQFNVACLSAGLQVLAVGMDGKVSQESSWEQHVENYQRIHGFHLPPIAWCKYPLEVIAKTAQLYWTSGKVFLPAEYHNDQEGEWFEDDFFAFTGKKLPGGNDDGPDAFCNGIQLMIDWGLGEVYYEVKIVTAGEYRLGRRPHRSKL